VQDRGRVGNTPVTRRSDDVSTDQAEAERHGMDWLIAGVLLILIVAMLVRLKKSERRS
jgi:hypothetical protein